MPRPAASATTVSALDVAGDRGGVSACHSDSADDSAVAKVEEGLDGAAGRGQLVEVVVLGVVEVDEGEVVDPEPLQALLHRDAHPGSGVVAVLGVHLGDDHGVGGVGAAQCLPDASFALPAAVAVGGVDDPDRAREDDVDEVDGPLLGDLVAEDLGHAGERGAAEADGGDG
jgi:hypothetical protein